MSFDHRLRQQFVNAERQMPHASVDWATTIARGKRERMYRMALVAAAAVFLVGGGALSARSLMEDDPAPLPGPAGTVDGQPTPQETPTEGISEGADPSVAGPRVLEWAKALSEDNAGAAWDMMSPASKEYYGSLKSFEDNMGEFVEGWAAWHSSAESPQTDVRVLASSGEGSLAVVTVYGVVTKEGMTGYDADSIVVRIAGTVALVEPYSSKIDIQPIEPAFDQAYTSSTLPAEFSAEVPSDVSQVTFYVEGAAHDGALATVKAKEANGSQPPNSIATAPAPEGISPGRHFVTIAAVDANGEVALQVVPFELAE